jgi:hypothetical protein
MAVTESADAAAPAGGETRSRFPALQYRDFRIIWIGMFFASATMMFQFYAQGWFLIGLTSSVAMLGVAGLSRGAGMLIFSMYGGALADRMDRRTLLITTQSCALAIYAVLSVLVLLDTIALWQTFVLIFFAAAVEAVDAPARRALIRTWYRVSTSEPVALLTARSAPSLPAPLLRRSPDRRWRRFRDQPDRARGGDRGADDDASAPKGRAVGGHDHAEHRGRRALCNVERGGVVDHHDQHLHRRAGIPVDQHARAVLDAA